MYNTYPKSDDTLKFPGIHVTATFREKKNKQNKKKTARNFFISLFDFSRNIKQTPWPINHIIVNSSPSTKPSHPSIHLALVQWVRDNKRNGATVPQDPRLFTLPLPSASLCVPRLLFPRLLLPRPTFIPYDISPH